MVDQASAGRIVLFTSGQHLGPMPDELPYAISKGAVHQVTRTLGRRTRRSRDHRQCDQPGAGRHGLALSRAARAPAPRLPGWPLGTLVGIAILSTIGTGALYVALFVLMLVAAAVVIPPAALEQEVNAAANVGEYASTGRSASEPSTDHR